MMWIGFESQTTDRRHDIPELMGLDMNELGDGGQFFQPSLPIGV